MVWQGYDKDQSVKQSIFRAITVSHRSLPKGLQTLFDQRHL